MKTAIAFLFALLLAASPAIAASDDHDRARRAVQAGEVLPLRTILENAARDCPGDIIETEMEDWHGTLAYEIKLITPEGRVVKLIYDARDGKLLKSKGRQP